MSSYREFVGEISGRVADNAEVSEVRISNLQDALTVLRPEVALVLDHPQGPTAILRRRGLWLLVQRIGKRRRWTSQGRLLRRLGRAPVTCSFIRPRNKTTGMRTAPGEPPPRPLDRAIRLLKIEREDVGVVAIYAAALGLLSMAVPVTVQALVNTVAFGTLLQPLIVLTLLLALALLGALYLRALQFRIVEMLQRRVFVRVVSELSHILPRVRADVFRKANGGELLNRFFDVFTTQKAVSSLVLGGIDALLLTLVGLTLLALYHPALLAFDIAMMLGAFVVFFLLGKGGTRTALRESKAKYTIAAWLEEMARHQVEVKTEGGSHLARRHADALAFNYLQERAGHFRIVYRQYIGTLVLQVAASVALLALGGYLVIERSLSLGQLVAAEIIVTAVVAALAKLGGKIEIFFDLLAALDKLGVVLDLPVEQEAVAVRSTRVIGRQLQVKGWKACDDRESFSFDVHPGDVVLLAEWPGSAREALADALAGVMLASGTTVSLDGVTQSELGLSMWRSHVALVREPELLADSVAEHLSSAHPTVTEEAMWQALDAVGLVREVEALTRGLNAPISDLRGTWSREQNVRLTLARALLSKTDHLVIDGALDAIRVQDRERFLHSEMAHRVGLIIFSYGAGLQGSANRVVNFSDDTAPAATEPADA